MGAITQAMARACREAGVVIHTETGVKRVLTDKLGVSRRRDRQW